MDSDNTSKLIKKLLQSCCEFKFDQEANLKVQMTDAETLKSNLLFVNGHLTQDDPNICEAIQYMTQLIEEQNLRKT
jgi:hypothetical protein